MSEDRSAAELARACGAWMAGRDRAFGVLGIEVETVTPGAVEVSMRVREDMLNSQGTCHGGMLFTLADCAFALACNSHGEVAVAAAASIEYLRPAFAGDRLSARAGERFLRGRTGIYDVAVSNAAGEAVALFRGRSRRLGREVLDPAADGDGGGRDERNSSTTEEERNR